jgi:hypothetical protein
MKTESSTRALGAFLGLGYIALGIGESIDHIGELSLVFWFSILCGGGVLVLIGVFKIVNPAWASIGLAAVGALAGGLAAAWTVLAPILSITLIVLTVLRARRATASTA